jgi:Fe/S biogenesis protein NfuA
MTTNGDFKDSPLINITPPALEKVLGFRSGTDQPEDQAMWVEITGISGLSYTYTMYLKPIAEAGAQDMVEDHNGLAIVVPEGSVDKVRGATIEWSGDMLQGGLALDNPNGPSPAVGAHAPLDLSGDAAQRVVQVLEQQINPSIAAHGGRADLVAVEEGTAYLRLSGGCQGCGMASVTLNQGIEVALTEAIPEVERVVDVTDHASGTNPYFEAAKK